MPFPHLEKQFALLTVPSNKSHSIYKFSPSAFHQLDSKKCERID